MKPEVPGDAPVNTPASHAPEAARRVAAAVAVAGVAMAVFGSAAVANAAPGDDSDAHRSGVSRPSTSNTAEQRRGTSAGNDSAASETTSTRKTRAVSGARSARSARSDAEPSSADGAVQGAEFDLNEESAAEQPHSRPGPDSSDVTGDSPENPVLGTADGETDLDITPEGSSVPAVPEEPAPSSTTDPRHDMAATRPGTHAAAATEVNGQRVSRLQNFENEPSLFARRRAAASITDISTDVQKSALVSVQRTTPDVSLESSMVVPASESAGMTLLSAPAAVAPTSVTVKSIVADLMTWIGLGRFATNLPGPGLPVPGLLESAWMLVRQSQYRWNNQRPSADPTAATELNPDGAVVGDLNAVDYEGDALTYFVTGAPTHGTVVIDEQGHFTYIPDVPAGSAVIDKFTVTIEDNVGNPRHYYGLLGLAGILKAPTVTVYVAVTSLGDVSIAPPPRPLEAALLAAKVYLYGYPLLEIERLQAQSPAPNTLIALTSYIEPDQHLVVAPNVDTLYTLAYIDLHEGPVVLSHPDMGDRYFVFQLMDPYTNVVGYIGSRTTGSEAATYAIVWEDGPEGEIPPDANIITVPYSDIWLLGRTLAGDEADQQEAVALMRQYSITAPGGSATYPIEDFDTTTSAALPTGLDALDAISDALADSPPPDHEADKLVELIRVGVGPGLAVSDANLSRASQWAAQAAVHAVSALLDPLVSLAQYRMAAQNEGWASPDPAIGDYGTDYLLRAGVAKIGLGANTPEEAYYATAFLDENLRRLNGQNSYQLHFEPGQEPPAEAFWSITVYDAEGFLVPNEAEIYAVSSTGSGNLVYQEDGSIDIVFSQEDPNDATVNWIPVPDGAFRVYLRVYAPDEEVLEGSWVVPGIQRL